ncbi:hypothetical protein [Glycomyces sp. NPDC047010]|uniref:hypothetical protein n=1 Tax=Glycomyces sp. NPDC047010 TaxID=3155023 RepID=UPI0033C8002B
MKRIAPLAAVFALAACGQGAADTTGAGDADTASDPLVYQGSITVLQPTERDSAGLCAFVAESYPPQCEGLPVTGWEWDAVEHQEAEGVRWGTYVVQGTFDGKQFALTDDPLPLSEVDPADYQPAAPEFGEPAEALAASELTAIADEMTAEFPTTVFAGGPDEANGVALVDALLVTPEMEAYAAEHFPADTVVFTSVLQPVE